MRRRVAPVGATNERAEIAGNNEAFAVVTSDHQVMGDSVTNTLNAARAKVRGYWMRPVSFVGLLRVLHFLAEFPMGLGAGGLNVKILERGLYPIKRGEPSVTTLYHVRNTLLHLGAIRRGGPRYIVNAESSRVRQLLHSAVTADSELPSGARDAFCELVIGQANCREHFFNLFMEQSEYGATAFRSAGKSVVWKRSSGVNGVTSASLRGVDGKEELLRTPVQIKSILYGVRYWARKELLLVDEFFREDRGSIMFPVLLASGEAEVEDAIVDVLNSIERPQEWTTLSLADLAVTCCERGHRRVDALRAAIREIAKRYPGEVLLVPTSRAFATIRARSRQREELELATYYMDAQKRYISHVKMHRSLLDKARCKEI